MYTLTSNKEKKRMRSIFIIYVIFEPSIIYMTYH